MVYIYTLQLEQGKYYVGKTNNPQFRLENHFTSNGSEWTKIYKPIRVLELKPNCDDYDEDKITKQYMNKYGIQNVRGGSYSRITLIDWQIKALQNECRSTKDVCFNCGLSGHFSKVCPSKKQDNIKKTIKKEITDLDSKYGNLKQISSAERTQGYIEEATKLKKETNVISITMYKGRYRQLTVNNDNYAFGVLIPYILNRDSERKCGLMYSTGQTNKLYTYEIKQYLQTVIQNKEHMIEMFNTDMIVSFGRDNYDSNMDKIYNFIFGKELPQKAQYVICDYGLGCRGCYGSDVCPGYSTQTLYVDDYGIVYNEFTEIYEKCNGKYNYKFHNTGKLYLNFK